MKTLFYICLVAGLWGLAACADPLDCRVEHVLDFAGDNRGELEAVLAHYRDDPEKLHAARLLIAEMEEAYYYDAPEVDSLRRMVRDVCTFQTYPGQETVRRWEAFDYRTLPKKYDAQTLSADYLIGQIESAFASWQRWPWAGKYSYEDFCRYILPYRIGDETPDRWREAYMKSLGAVLDSLYTGTDPIEAADTLLRHFYRLPHAYVVRFATPHLGALHLLDCRAGGCREYTDFMVYMYRALGIPVVKDQFLCAPDFRHAHTWNALMDTTGRFIPVEFMEARDTSDIRRHWQNRRNKGKVYRLYDVRQDEPDFAGNHYRADVTDEYYPANRVDVPVEPDGGRGLLAVFATEGWKPVGGYRSRRGKAVVEDVQEEMIFQPLSVRDGKLRESGWPFFVRQGRAVVLKPDTAHRVQVRLVRKYPIGWRLAAKLDSIVGNVLEGSLTPDFRHAELLGEIKGSCRETAGRCVMFPPGYTCRYVRVRPAAGNVVNLAELEFFADEARQEKLPYNVLSCGKPHYTVGINYPATHLQDGNILTNYISSETDVPVVVDFGCPVALRAAVLTPRNDDNFVRPGETYELFYQDGANGWVSLGRQVAAGEVLEYDEVPDNALLWLRNLTKGREEQVFRWVDFRWVDGRQVFLGTMKGG